MHCQPCGRENPDDAAFCAGCGHPLHRACGACGRANDPDARFCNGCGAPVGEAAPDPPVREPRDYTPHHLAERILRSRSALEGERKKVTILFADVKSSTSLAGSLDPEAWHGILDGYFRILADGVHRFEGTINQYTGDGIMALFGAPLAHEDHAQRACWAARWLRDPLRRHSDEVRREHGRSFSARIGIHTGEVVVGKIGDDLRMDYTAQGLAANLARRIQELAEPGTIYLSDDTARLVAGYFEFADLGELKIRGLDHPTRVHRLEDAGSVSTRLALSRSRGFTRFVGREREFEMLESALARTVEGTGSVVSIVGEAGVGKSRLCLEFVERCRVRGVPVWEAHCPSHGRAVPLLPVLQLSRGFFGINEADDPAAARQKIAGTLVLLDAALQEDIPLACDFLQVPDPERPPPPMDAEIRRRRVQEFLRRLVEARSERQPAVILFDDLHWIDPESESFLEGLIPTIGATRTLLLTNLRPEYEAPWRTRSDYQQIPLSPLGRAEADALAAHLLGSDPSLGDLRARLVERSGGNPFFTEELVRGLADADALQGEPGAYRAGEPVDVLVLPPTVQGILAARIDRLGEREKRLLQTAAVIGREVAEPVLRRVADLPDGDLEAALDHLDQGGLLIQQSLYPVAEYAFRHPLIQEVAYASQLGARRSATHAEVARAIEELESERLDERASLLAHHWESAEDAARAAHWHRRAAVGEYRSDEACLRHWQRTRELLADLEASEANLRGRIEACTAILYEIWSTGLAADASDEIWESVFEEGLELTRSLGDDTARASLLSGVAGLRGFRGEHRVQVELLEEALELIRDRGAFAVEASLLQRIGWAWGLAGDNLREIEWSRRGVEFCERDLPRSGAVSGFGTYAFLLGQLGRALIEDGRLDEGEELLDRADAVSLYTGDPFSYGAARSARRILQWIRGNRDEQLRIARSGVEGAAATGSTLIQEMSFGMLTAALAEVGDWNGAVEASQAGPGTGLIRAIDLGFRLVAVRAHAELGEIDRAREMLAEIRRAYERVPALKDDDPLALLDWTRALRVLDGAAAREEIERSTEQILEATRSRGWRSLAPFARLERAELARLLGDEPAREGELRRAAELFREIGAPRCAEEAEADIGS